MVILGWSCLYTQFTIISFSLTDPNPLICPQLSGPAMEAVVCLNLRNRKNSQINLPKGMLKKYVQTCNGLHLISQSLCKPTKKNVQRISKSETVTYNKKTCKQWQKWFYHMADECVCKQLIFDLLSHFFFFFLCVFHSHLGIKSVSKFAFYVNTVCAVQRFTIPQN